MNSGKYTRGLAALVLCALALGGARAARAQQPQQGPVTNAEFLAVVRQLPARPGLKDQLVGEIRRRGINFTLTSGLRSFVATKSGNDEGVCAGDASDTASGAAWTLL